MQKKIVDKLVAEYAENIVAVKVAEITLAWHENVCVCSYTICVILAAIALAISIRIGTYFAYFNWYLKKMLLVLRLALALVSIAPKQQFYELINGKSQANRDQKSNLLSLQQHNYYRRI